jgi:hypothetical protein
MTLKMDILVNEELLKDRLTECRELCPLLLDVFIWRTNLYPCILGGIVTFIFGLFWYIEPTVITTIAVIGLILTLADFLLPLLSKSVGPAPADWTPEKEKKFSIFVNRIAYYSVQFWNFTVTLEEWKLAKPNVYSAGVIGSLLIIAWIGNAVNNLLLSYFLVLFLTLLPGLLHRRILQKYVSKAVVMAGHYLGVKPKQK